MTRELRLGEYTVTPDRIEAGTFIMSAAGTGGQVLVKKAVPEHLKMELKKLHGMGMDLNLEEANIRGSARRKALM